MTTEIDDFDCGKMMHRNVLHRLPLTLRQSACTPRPGCRLQETQAKPSMIRFKYPKTLPQPAIRTWPKSAAASPSHGTRITLMPPRLRISPATASRSQDGLPPFR